MHRLSRFGYLAIVLLLALPAAGGNWPSFRGPAASGVDDSHPTATTWNGESGENILWTAEIPGLGHASPVIWGDQLFIVTAVAQSEDPASLKVGLYGDIAAADDDGMQSWRVYCLDKKSGEVRWQRGLHEGKPATQRHTKATHANSTPATDGERIAVLLGSQGLHVLDLTGRLLWKKDFGKLRASFFSVPDAEWGYGASPILHEGRLIVQVDVLGESFLAMFDAADGRELWRTKREDYPTWSTPAIAPQGDGEGLQVVVNGYKHRGGYDYQTGAELWKLAGGGDIPIPTPIVGDGLIFFSSSHGSSSPVYAVRTSARGDVTPKGEKLGEHVAWRAERRAAYMPTPILYGKHLYVCRDRGVLSCFDAKTGEELYQERLHRGSSGFTASPVAADGKLYLTSEDGVVHVVRAGTTYEKLAENSLGETVLATPAISGGGLYFRGRHHVIAVGGGS